MIDARLEISVTFRHRVVASVGEAGALSQLPKSFQAPAALNGLLRSNL